MLRRTSPSLWAMCCPSLPPSKAASRSQQASVQAGRRQREKRRAYLAGQPRPVTAGHIRTTLCGPLPSPPSQLLGTTALAGGVAECSTRAWGVFGESIASCFMLLAPRGQPMGCAGAPL